MIKPRTLAGQTVPPIGLGCMSLSHAYKPRPSEAYGERLLNEAIDIGYRHLDSARLYGLGHNEAMLSRVLKDRRDGLLITSKCGIEFDDGKRRIDCRPATIRKAVEKSLTTLGVDHIDLYYLHRRDFDTPIEESVGALAALKAEGKIGAIGLSEMSADTLRRADAEHPVAAMQTEFSLWTRNAEISVLNTCQELGTAFVAFSPLGRGVLAGGVTDPASLEDGDIRKGHPRFSAEHWPANRSLAEGFFALAEAAGITPAQLALQWVLAQGDNIHVIPGTGSIEHMRENFEAGSRQVSQETLDQAGTLINQSTVSGHRYPEGMRKTIDTEDFV